jgi:hypothetical protein
MALRSSVADDLQAQFTVIDAACGNTVDDERGNSADGRTAVAEFCASNPHRAVLFKMFDNKPCADLNWKSLRPAYALPMRVDTDVEPDG